KRALRWVRFDPSASTGSKPGNSPAIRVASEERANWVIGLIPDCPATSAFQVDGASRPTGVSAPSPVTTGSPAGFTAEGTGRSCKPIIAVCRLDPRRGPPDRGTRRSLATGPPYTVSGSASLCSGYLGTP